MSESAASIDPRPAVATADAGPPAAQAAAHLAETQAAARALLTEFGLESARPTEVGRALGLDKSLAWKLATFVRDADPSAAARHLPGTAGVEIVLRAAEERGAEATVVAAVRDAEASLRAFVSAHAGDRRSFEAMLSEGGGGGAAADSDARKAFFRAASVAFGVRARTQMLTLALRPSREQPAMLDFVMLSGLVELERLRTDLPWILRRFHVHDDDGKPIGSFERVPLDPDAPEGMPIMTRHCSHPRPEIRGFDGGDGLRYDELVPGPVGRSGRVTCIMGERYVAAASHEAGPANREARYPLTIRTPVEGVQFDLLLHPELEHFAPARLEVRGLLEARPRPSTADADASGGRTPSIPIGPPLDLGGPRVPRYDELVREAFDRAGWESPDTFRGYRADLDHPLAPSEIVLSCAIGTR